MHVVVVLVVGRKVGGDVRIAGVMTMRRGRPE